MSLRALEVADGRAHWIASGPGSTLAEDGTPDSG